jgi:Ca2+-binding EF-hand superfamily protein
MKEALIDLGLFTTEQNLDVLFRQLDKDQSGTLDFEASNLTKVSS